MEHIKQINVKIYLKYTIFSTKNISPITKFLNHYQYYIKF